MSNYFDKNFFKFLLGFAAIVMLSFLIIFATRIYQSTEVPTASAGVSVSP